MVLNASTDIFLKIKIDVIWNYFLVQIQHWNSTQRNKREQITKNNVENKSQGKLNMDLGESECPCPEENLILEGQFLHPL